MTAAQLAAELMSDDPARRLAAADGLATMGPDALPACCALVRACADPTLRDLCVGALEELGAPAPDAMPHLADLLRHEDETAAYWAATLLGRAGPAAAAHQSALQQVAADPSRSEAVQDRAGWALGRVTP